MEFRILSPLEVVDEERPGQRHCADEELMAIHLLDMGSGG
jgi:hypothetical protein